MPPVRETRLHHTTQLSSQCPFLTLLLGYREKRSKYKLSGEKLIKILGLQNFCSEPEIHFILLFRDNAKRKCYFPFILLLLHLVIPTIKGLTLVAIQIPGLSQSVAQPSLSNKKGSLRVQICLFRDQGKILNVLQAFVRVCNLCKQKPSCISLGLRYIEESVKTYFKYFTLFMVRF